jgi:hypothetical protein
MKLLLGCQFEFNGIFTPHDVDHTIVNIGEEKNYIKEYFQFLVIATVIGDGILNRLCENVIPNGAKRSEESLTRSNSVAR